MYNIPDIASLNTEKKELMCIYSDQQMSHLEKLKILCSQILIVSKIIILLECPLLSKHFGSVSSQ